MNGFWTKTEDFTGEDTIYESPLLTYDGAVRIKTDITCIEGAAVTLVVHPDAASVGSVDLTLDEAREVPSWLLRAVEEVELAAVRYDAQASPSHPPTQGRKGDPTTNA